MNISDNCICGSKFIINDGEDNIAGELYKQWMQLHSACRENRRQIAPQTIPPYMQHQTFPSRPSAQPPSHQGFSMDGFGPAPHQSRRPMGGFSQRPMSPTMVPTDPNQTESDIWASQTGQMWYCDDLPSSVAEYARYDVEQPRRFPNRGPYVFSRSVDVYACHPDEPDSGYDPLDDHDGHRRDCFLKCRLFNRHKEVYGLVLYHWDSETIGIEPGSIKIPDRLPKRVDEPIRITHQEIFDCIAQSRHGDYFHDVYIEHWNEPHVVIVNANVNPRPNTHHTQYRVWIGRIYVQPDTVEARDVLIVHRHTPKSITSSSQPQETSDDESSSDPGEKLLVQLEDDMTPTTVTMNQHRQINGHREVEGFTMTLDGSTLTIGPGEIGFRGRITSMITESSTIDVLRYIENRSKSSKQSKHTDHDRYELSVLAIYNFGQEIRFILEDHDGSYRARSRRTSDRYVCIGRIDVVVTSYEIQMRVVHNNQEGRILHATYDNQLLSKQPIHCGKKTVTLKGCSAT